MSSGTTTALSLRSTSLLSDRALASHSSALRDLLAQATRPGMISLAGGLPDASSFPTVELADIASGAISRDATVLQYGTTAGTESARMALAELFGSATDPDDVVVTTGSQQALDLIARCVLNPGDAVIAGDPDYLGALQAFRAYGADIRPIAVDVDGMDTDQLEQQLRSGLRPQCCYIVPNFHNPTGSSLAPHRRTHLYELSARYDFLVIEDDPYRDLFYEAPVAELEGNEVNASTVQLRSTSKTLAPGLRIGALVGPRWLRNAVVTAKQSVDLHTSTLSQAIVTEALRAPWYPNHLDELRSRYRSKRDVLVEALTRQFGDEVQFAVPAGGMFLWARFDRRTDTAQWLDRCLDRGVCFVPGTAFAVDRDLSSHARFSFATGSETELEEAVRRLRSAR